MSSQAEAPTPFLGALNEAVTRFGAIRIEQLCDRYVRWPNEEQSKLGSGSYGEAFRVRSVDADVTREPERVAKVIPKSRIAKNGTQVQHLCAELAVSGILDHPNLNHRVGLFHNDSHIFVILELCGGPRPDLATRIAHLFAYRRPSRFPDIDRIISHWALLANDAGITGATLTNEQGFTTILDEKALGDFVDRQGLMKALAAECGVNLTRDNPELPVANDLFNFIVAYRRISDPFASIILRQVLEGIEFLHANQIVHRDMKTENVVIGVIRKAVLKRDENGVCCGASFYEKIDSKVIDFGLVKYMNIGNSAVVSPGAFIRATATAAAAAAAGAVGSPGDDAAAPTSGAAVSSEKKKKQNEGDDDDDEDDDDQDEEEGTSCANRWNAAGMAEIQRPPQAGSVTAFDPVAVTPCGTEIYCSLEALNGILNAGLGQARAKWTSTKQTLPKMDIFGVGACLYCCSNGKPPFRPPETYRRISREERMRQIEKLVAQGPIFVPQASPASREMTMKLMDNDVLRRYTASQALQDPFVNHSTNVVVTESTLDGIIAIRHGTPSEFPAAVKSGQQGIAAGSGGSVTVSAVSAHTGSTTAMSSQTPSGHSQTQVQQQQQQQQQQQVDEDDAHKSRSRDAEVGGDDNRGESDDDDDEEETAAALNDVMEALRNREDDGDAAGKDNAKSNQQQQTQEDAAASAK